MCSVVILYRPGHAWPMLIAANRDEMAGRPWKPPARHWPDRADVVAGLDEEAGGTWLGLNDYGVVAAVLNRPGTLGRESGKRSRGELPLDALDHAAAADAVDALKALETNHYRPFNMVVADRREAFWLRSTGEGAPVEAFAVPPGLHMVTAHDLDDSRSSRIATHLPRFRAAPEPDPAAGDWTGWAGLMASRLFDAEKGPRGAMTVVMDGGFGTVSSSLIAVPAPQRTDEGAKWLFATGRPGENPYESVDLAP